MFYSAIPAISLQPFIENIWYCYRHVKNMEQTITLPFGRMEMAIKFSGDYSILHQQKRFEGKDLWITGQQTKPVITSVAGHHECMGVVFTALGWNSFFKFRANEFVNKSVSLVDIWGKESSSLRNELAEIKDIAAKFTRLQQFLLNRLLKNDGSFTIQSALHLVQQNRNIKKIIVNDLCMQLKISRKSLNEHFQHYIGLSTSGYLQQLVFNDVIKDISNTPQERLIEVGYDHHFFDQAHFIKQFQFFSGMTPGQYLQLVKYKAVDKAFPNFIPGEVTFLQ